MPRERRIQSGTGVYHVMMRGINRQRVFEDTEDHYIFLQCLSSAQEQYSPEGERLPPIVATTMHMPLCSELVETPLGEHVSRLNTKMYVAEACQTIRSCYTSLKNLASVMVSSCNVSIRNNAMTFFPHC